METNPRAYGRSASSSCRLLEWILNFRIACSSKTCLLTEKKKWEQGTEIPGKNPLGPVSGEEEVVATLLEWNHEA